MGKTTEEKIKETERKIHRLQMEKQKLVNKDKQDQKRKRNHAMIVLATSWLTYFDKDIENYIIGSDDVTIRAWVAKQVEKMNGMSAEMEHEKMNDQINVNDTKV